MAKKQILDITPVFMYSVCVCVCVCVCKCQMQCPISKYPQVSSDLHIMGRIDNNLIMQINLDLKAYNYH